MIGQLMRKYLNETSLHGFAYADDKNKFFVAFWSLLTAACVILAVRDISNLIQFARTDPTSFTFEVKSDDYQPLPIPTLCMEILVIPPDNITIEDVETDIQTFIKARTISNTTATTTTTTITTDPNWIPQWVDPTYDGERIMTDKLEYVTYMMLGYITDSEMQLIRLNNQLLTEYATKYIAKPGDIQKLTRTAYEAYRGYNFATDRYVRDTVTSQIRFINTLSATRTYYLSRSDLGIFPVQLTPLQFGPNCDGTILNPQTGIQMFPEFLWHLDLQGRSSPPPTPSSDIVSFEPALATASFELVITTEYQFYNRKLSPYLPPTGELQHKCKRRKIVERLSLACNCWPSSFIDITKPAAMPNCNDQASLDVTNISLNCSKINLNVDDADCPKDCLRYTFDINPTESFSLLNSAWIYQWNRLVGRAHISFAPDSLRFVITESPIMSFTIFACSFGGTIGTWLGGSLLAFIHIPIFFVANLTAKIGKHKKVDKTKTEKIEINTIAKDVIYPPIAVA